jgi:hypothetical protein
MVERACLEAEGVYQFDHRYKWQWKVWGRESKIMNLMEKEYFVAIDGSRIDVMFMSRWGETKQCG